MKPKMRHVCKMSVLLLCEVFNVLSFASATVCIRTGKSLLSFKVLSGKSQENFAIRDAQGLFF